MINALKIWEGRTSYLLWQAKLANSPDRKKFHLKATVEGNDVTVAFVKVKPDDLKPNGSLVSFLRKHAKSSFIEKIYRHSSSKNIWIPLSKGKSTVPQLYILLRSSRPAEMHIIDENGLSHFRRTSKNTFTKKSKFEEGIPDFSKDEFEDLLPKMIGVLQSERLAQQGEISDVDNNDIDVEDEEEISTENDTLPMFQRQARDKAVRRLKTLRKSEKKMIAQIADETEIADLKLNAKYLQTYLYLAKPDDLSLTIAPELTGLDTSISIPLDPELKPSQNLENFFIKIGKYERSRITGTKKLVKLRKDIDLASSIVDQIRGEHLPEGVVSSLLDKLGLAVGSKEQSAKFSAKNPVKVPYRKFVNQEGVPLLVGKAAADNDILTKSAKSNDTWVHVVGIPGSHVIIPAKATKGNPSPTTLKSAGMLAIHFSKLRQDRAGEVYITTKGQIRKQKGMPAGLWLVEKAKSMFFRYDKNELDQLMQNEGD